MAALLTACGHRADKAATDADSIRADSLAVVAADNAMAFFAVDSIGVERNDSMASVTVLVDWPADGELAVAKAVMQYLCEALDTAADGTKRPVAPSANGRRVVKTFAGSKWKELTGYWTEMAAEGIAPGMPYSFYLRASKDVETPQFVTYVVNTEGYQGGAHGYATSEGVTFRKSDGFRPGYQLEVIDHEDGVRHRISRQTLFTNSESPRLYSIIKEGVRSYFSDVNQDAAKISDAELAGMLLGIDDVNRIPLPSSPPCFTRKGLSFIYQQYEIACYAAGMVNFVVPYDVVSPLLTDDARSLIPR